MLITEHERRHTHIHKLRFMNIHGFIRYVSLQWAAGKHLTRMLMKQGFSTLLFSLCVTLLSHSLSDLLYEPCTLSITICLVSFLSLYLALETVYLRLFNFPFLTIDMGGPLFLYTPPSPSAVFSPRETGPHAMLWWSFSSRSDTLYLHEPVVS